MIAALSVAGGILSTILVFILGVWSVKNTNKAALATKQLSAQTDRNTDDTARLRILAESYDQARIIDREAVERLRIELSDAWKQIDTMKNTIESLRYDLSITRAELTVSERNTARAERNVQTLRNLLIQRDIPVPDLEGGNGNQNGNN